MTMPLFVGNPAVLVVSPHRDDRRVLFDWLDDHECEAIYTAKDISQAVRLLDQEPELDLIFLDLGGDHGNPAELLKHIWGQSRWQETRLVGIWPEAARTSQEPAGIDLSRFYDCLTSPIRLEEIVFRLENQARSEPQSSSEVAATSVDARSDSVLGSLFAGDQIDYVVFEDSGRILSGSGRFEAEGRGWNECFSPIDSETAKERKRQLDREGELRYQTQWLSPDADVVPVAVEVRRGSWLEAGTQVALVRLAGEEQSCVKALDSMAALWQGRQPEISNLLAKMAQSFELNCLVAVELRVDENQDKSLKVLAACGRGDSRRHLTDIEGHTPYARVLEGEAVMARTGAADALGDEYLAGRQFESYVGLPLIDSRGGCLGALVAASRDAIEHWSVARKMLEGIAGWFSRTLELKRYREEFRAQNLRDSLTGLPNRLLFTDRLGTSIREAQRTGEMFAVLFIDLDRFKTINDSLGHSVGDEVLIGVAKKLAAGVRNSDTVARYAGDEFTVILRHIVQREDAQRIAGKLNKLLAEPLRLRDESELPVTASIGLSFFPDDGADGDMLVKHADIAMYNAKAMGRNNFQTFVAVAEEGPQQKLVLEAKLRSAQANNELRVFYQPQIDAKTEEIVGVEALVRWHHPELGLISPGFFIPLAEETGLIVSIGEWVLRTACTDVKSLQDRFGIPLRLSVNLSPLQLRQPTLLTVVENALEDSRFDAENLELEITESIDVKSIDHLRDLLSAFRELGASIAIDDFGTGQASLDYLKRFPADRIKIDQTFVRNIGLDPDDEAIVQSTIAMAHRLKLGVTAEGVEEENHLNFLRKHECDEVQGFLFCRPIPGESLARLLADRERILQAGVAT